MVFKQNLEIGNLAEEYGEIVSEYWVRATESTVFTEGLVYGLV